MTFPSSEEPAGPGPAAPDPGAPPEGAHGLARDAGWSFAALLVTFSSSFVVTGLGFRMLSNQLMGVYSIAASTTALMLVVDPAIALGISRSVARRNAGQDESGDDEAFIRGAHALLTWLGVGTLLFGSLVGAIARLVGLLTVSDASWLMLVLLWFACAVQISTAGFAGVLTGRSDFFHQARAAVVYGVVAVATVAILLPSIGVVALGLGQLLAVVASRALLMRRARRTDRDVLVLRPAPPSAAETVHLVRFATPMLLLWVSAQVMVWIDVVVVGAHSGAAVAALLRAGSIVPVALLALVYRAYDTAFPRLSAGDDDWQVTSTVPLTRVFSAGSAVVFSALVATRSEAVHVLTGGASHLAALVVVLGSLAWVANVPVHGLSLVAMARGLHGAITPVVVGEAVANVCLTVVLVTTWRPQGAVVATLIAQVIANLLVLPVLLQRHIPGAVRLVLLDGLGSLLAAGVPAVVLLEVVSRSVPGAVASVALVAVAGAMLLVASVWTAAGASGRRALLLSIRGRPLRAQ